MIGLHIKLDEDPAWPDLAEQRERIIHLAEGTVIEVAALAGGMQSGRTSLALRIDLPDGQVVIAETSLRLFLNAARVLQAKYPEGY